MKHVDYIKELTIHLFLSFCPSFSQVGSRSPRLRAYEVAFPHLGIFGGKTCVTRAYRMYLGIPRKEKKLKRFKNTFRFVDDDDLCRMVGL